MNEILQLCVIGDMRPGVEQILDFIGRALQMQMCFYALLGLGIMTVIVALIAIVAGKWKPRV